MLGARTHTKKVSKAMKTISKGPDAGLAPLATMFKNQHTYGDRRRVVTQINNKVSSAVPNADDVALKGK